MKKQLVQFGGTIRRVENFEQENITRVTLQLKVAGYLGEAMQPITPITVRFRLSPAGALDLHAEGETERLRDADQLQEGETLLAANEEIRFGNGCWIQFVGVGPLEWNGTTLFHGDPVHLINDVVYESIRGKKLPKIMQILDWPQTSVQEQAQRNTVMSQALAKAQAALQEGV